MRRSASEVIRSLEMRIARLERRAGLVLDSKEQKHLNELTDSIRRFFQDSNTAASLFSKGGKKYESFAKKLQEMNDLIAEVSKDLPNQVRSLNKEEFKASKKASRIPLKQRQLQTVLMHINDEFGLDEMDEEVDLELSVRDWTHEHSSVVNNRRSRLHGSKILVLSIEGGIYNEVYYAIFVETSKDDWTEMGLFEGVRSYESKLDRLERGM